MADNIKFIKEKLGKLDTKPGLGQKVEQMVEMGRSRRKNFEQRWYDNNFFDDGYHFRYVSRTTGKIIDLSQKRGVSNSPLRAIPKASRQIRGVANLLFSAEPTPVVYPEAVERQNYPTVEQYGMALEAAKESAQKIGHWITEEWNSLGMKEKITQMILLTAKHGVSYMQVWPDPIDEKIRTQVYDAFDIYVLGNVTELEDSPFVIKAVPRQLSKVMVDERFDMSQREKLIADNLYAESKIKQAYMRSRYGSSGETDEGQTVIVKEAFIKEYLTEENKARIGEEHPHILKGKRDGDMVMRHVFVANGVWLKDEYIDLPKYPFIDFRFEPGPIYQTPLIERFIPANKTLDVLVSRIEKYLNTMVTGHWLVPDGQDIKISNISGGQVLRYKGTPPVQGNIAGLPGTIFNYIELLQGFMEEQGASTAALGQLPPGVKSGVAIESLKATEYANLKIATDQLKKTVKAFTERMIDIASDHFIRPQTVALLESGEPTYFDVIGKRGIEARESAKMEAPDAVVISKDYRVRVETEAGLGLTMQGKREAIQQIATFMVDLADKQLINPEGVKVVVKNLLETFKFGSTQELMEALDEIDDTQQMTEQQIQQVKVAVAEVLRDAGMGDPQQQVQTTKIGVVEALRDLQGGAAVMSLKKGYGNKAPSITISELMKSGKSKKRAIAIALSLAKKMKKKKGGKKND